MAPSNNRPDREGNILAVHEVDPHSRAEQDNQILGLSLHKRQDQYHKALVRCQPHGFRPLAAVKVGDWNDRCGLHAIENRFDGTPKRRNHD